MTTTTDRTAPERLDGERPVDVGAVLATGERPPVAGPLAASFAFFRRAMLRIKHVPEQLFDVTMFPIMFLLLFTYLFGGALAGSTGEYLQYLLPGILVMTVTMITMYTGMDLNGDIAKGVFDRFRSLPIWRPAVLVGALLGDTARYTMASTTILVLGLVLGFRPDGGAIGVLAGVALLLVFAFSLSWVWTALAMVLRTPESVVQVSMMVVFPLTFTSSILVDPATMPSWVQRIVEVNPITHLATAVRDLMHGTAQFGDVTLVLAISAGLVAVFGPLTMRLFARER